MYSEDVKEDSLWLMKGDCLERMKEIPSGSVDLILTDPPYGTTACKWDSVIPLEPMWEQLKRIIKPNGAIVMTASQPFTTILIHSNLKMFKYCWVWDKVNSSNFFAAKFQPLNHTEDLVVFSFGGTNNGCKNPMVYVPQGLFVSNITKTNNKVGGLIGKEHGAVYEKYKDYTQTTTNYPKKLITFKREMNTVHPTQKPVALMEYLIKTYTNENETVLDFTMGSGTTSVACMNTKRKFIGIERDDKYFDISVKRIKGELGVN